MMRYCKYCGKLFKAIARRSKVCDKCRKKNWNKLKRRKRAKGFYINKIFNSTS